MADNNRREYIREYQKENRKNWRKLLSIPSILATFKDEFLSLCRMEGECVRLEGTALPRRPQFRSLSAAEVAYRLYKGEIPRGMWILHRCGNGWCVNPEHLYLGTRRDNDLDKMLHGVQRKRLSRDDVLAIRAAWEHPHRTVTQYDLAKLYKVSRTTIEYVVTYRTHKFAEIEELLDNHSSSS